ncbi:Serine hydroxymethyltransferase 2 [Hibiscus syriacus]|uniref:Serine hydroxymethyltransferase 2 n=1 Tax=Hibiscus syriacus TaxID=106335 RepID=A0A6A3C0F8_HIBSY|nr:Serine hydroxymethyltransferase 2 [Hibiscus syriacus]
MNDAIFGFGEDPPIRLRLDNDALDTRICLQTMHIDFVVEVTNVANNGIVLHLPRVVNHDDVLVTGGGDKDISLGDDVFEGQNLKSFHESLKSTDGINLSDNDTSTGLFQGSSEALANITVTTDNSNLSGNHHIGSSHQTIGKRVTTSIQEAANPFEFCDIVTTTTHKSLRGPRAGMIFYRKGPKPPKKGQPEGAVYDFQDNINFSVFPSLQGGPHNHQIGALAVALKQAMSPGFKAYAKQVKANAVALGKYLMSKGFQLVTGGTENHLVLWDLTGNKVEKLCDLCNITVNKNAVFGDSSALAPGGVRIGTPAMISRGFVEKDFEQIGKFLHRAVTISSDIQKQYGKLLKDFNKGLENKEIGHPKAVREAFEGLQQRFGKQGDPRAQGRC